MLGPVDRVLALVGIGGYYLYKDFVWADKYEIVGPFKHPVNPYGDSRFYGMTSKTVYHLRRPKGDITSPPGEIISPRKEIE